MHDHRTGVGDVFECEYNTVGRAAAGTGGFCHILDSALDRQDCLPIHRGVYVIGTQAFVQSLHISAVRIGIDVTRRQIGGVLDEVVVDACICIACVENDYGIAGHIALGIDHNLLAVLHHRCKDRRTVSILVGLRVNLEGDVLVVQSDSGIDAVNLVDPYFRLLGIEDIELSVLVGVFLRIGLNAVGGIGANGKFKALEARYRQCGSIASSGGSSCRGMITVACRNRSVCLGESVGFACFQVDHCISISSIVVFSNGLAGGKCIAGQCTVGRIIIQRGCRICSVCALHLHFDRDSIGLGKRNIGVVITFPDLNGNQLLDVVQRQVTLSCNVSSSPVHDTRRVAVQLVRCNIAWRRISLMINNNLFYTIAIDIHVMASVTVGCHFVQLVQRDVFLIDIVIDKFDCLCSVCGGMGLVQRQIRKVPLRGRCSVDLDGRGASHLSHIIAICFRVAGVQVNLRVICVERICICYPGTCKPAIRLHSVGILPYVGAHQLAVVDILSMAGFSLPVTPHQVKFLHEGTVGGAIVNLLRIIEAGRDRLFELIGIGLAGLVKSRQSNSSTPVFYLKGCQGYSGRCGRGHLLPVSAFNLPIQLDHSAGSIAVGIAGKVRDGCFRNAQIQVHIHRHAGTLVHSVEGERMMVVIDLEDVAECIGARLFSFGEVNSGVSVFRSLHPSVVSRHTGLLQLVKTIRQRLLVAGRIVDAGVCIHVNLDGVGIVCRAWSHGRSLGIRITGKGKYGMRKVGSIVALFGDADLALGLTVAELCSPRVGCGGSFGQVQIIRIIRIEGDLHHIAGVLSRNVFTQFVFFCCYDIIVCAAKQVIVAGGCSGRCRLITVSFIISVYEEGLIVSSCQGIGHRTVYCLTVLAVRLGIAFVICKLLADGQLGRLNSRQQLRVLNIVCIVRIMSFYFIELDICR